MGAPCPEKQPQRASKARAQHCWGGLRVLCSCGLKTTTAKSAPTAAGSRRTACCCATTEPQGLLGRRGHAQVCGQLAHARLHALHALQETHARAGQRNERLSTLSASACLQHWGKQQCAVVWLTACNGRQVRQRDGEPTQSRLPTFACASRIASATSSFSFSTPCGSVSRRM